MINVTDETKAAYLNGASKQLLIRFPDINLTLTNADFVSESMQLNQSIESGQYLTFTGCIASQLQIQCVDLEQDVRGRRIEVSIQASDTETIKIFSGYVDSQSVKDYVSNITDIVAYDLFYELSQRNVALWYIDLFNKVESITIADFRASLFTYLGISAETTTLVNDSLTIIKQYSPKQMSALDLIKGICHLNGVYGCVNGDGIIEFRTLAKISGTNYTEIPYYKSLDYQRWSVVGIDKVTVRQDDSVDGQSFGEGNNTYIMQANMFTLNLSDEDLLSVATNVYPQVEGRVYVPYDSEIVGFPFVECGDILTYKVYDYKTNTTTDMPFYVLNRTLKGIQALFDTCSADGEQYRTVFESTLSVSMQLETIKQQIEDISGKMNNMSLTYLTFNNNKVVEIGDEQTKSVASAQFAVYKPCQVMVQMEYLIKCELSDPDVPMTVRMKYSYDNTFIDSRQPIETYFDGEHILHTFYIVNVEDVQKHYWRVFLEVNGGTVTIDQYQAQNSLLGLGSFVQANWDGTITIEENIPLIVLPTISVKGITDTVKFNLKAPKPIVLSDNVALINIPRINILGISDSLAFNEVYEQEIIEITPVGEEYPQVVITDDYAMTHTTILGVEKITVEDSADVLYAISVDEGETWNIWTGTTWGTVSDESSGMSSEMMNSISSNALSELMNTGKYRFRVVFPTKDSYITSFVVDYIN